PGVDLLTRGIQGPLFFYVYIFERLVLLGVELIRLLLGVLWHRHLECRLRLEVFCANLVICGLAALKQCYAACRLGMQPFISGLDRLLPTDAFSPRLGEFATLGGE